MPETFNYIRISHCELPDRKKNREVTRVTSWIAELAKPVICKNKSWWFKNFIWRCPKCGGSISATLEVPKSFAMQFLRIKRRCKTEFVHNWGFFLLTWSLNVAPLNWKDIIVIQADAFCLTWYCEPPCLPRKFRNALQFLCEIELNWCCYKLYRLVLLSFFLGKCSKSFSSLLANGCCQRLWLASSTKWMDEFWKQNVAANVGIFGHTGS